MPLLDMKVDKEAGTITLVLSLEKTLRPSKSGKTFVVAQSGGTASTGVLMDRRGQLANGTSGGKDVQVSAVAYIAK